MRLDLFVRLLLHIGGTKIASGKGCVGAIFGVQSEGRVEPYVHRSSLKASSAWLRDGSFQHPRAARCGRRAKPM